MIRWALTDTLTNERTSKYTESWNSISNHAKAGVTINNIDIDKMLLRTITNYFALFFNGVMPLD